MQAPPEGWSYASILDMSVCCLLRFLNFAAVVDDHQESAYWCSWSLTHWLTLAASGLLCTLVSEGMRG